MKLKRIPTIAITVIALALPIAAQTDVGGTVTLAAGAAFSLDTRATVSSGGDILWSGTSITPQGSATDLNITTTTGQSGAVNYATFSYSILSALGSAYTKAAISSPTVNTIIAVKTNGANYAKLLVTAVTGTSISLQYDTFVTSTTPTGPTITQILNNYGLIPAGFSNSGIAQGSIFIIKGSGLADPNAAFALLDPKAGSLPTTLNGSSVKVTVNGVAITPVFYYTYTATAGSSTAQQLALVLPSNTPIGNATVTVTYSNQTSAAAAFQVVQSGMGFDTYWGAGSGMGVATSAVDGSLYNYTKSIPPGTWVTLWGSGLGADPARDTAFVVPGNNGFPINTLAHIYIGGVDSPIQYQGASGWPGLNQVNVFVGQGVATGCNVSVVGVTAGGVPTNFVTLPIGTGVCSDPMTGASGTQLQAASGQNTVRAGVVDLLHDTSPTSSTGTASQTQDVAFADFISTTGSAYGSSSALLSVGSCTIVSQTAGTASTTTSTGLDAGSISVKGPIGSATLTEESTGLYYAAPLASGFVPSSGGTFTFTGTGGASVGAFSSTVSFPNPLLAWSNTAADATISRSAGATFTWTGGASGTYVSITGNSTGTVNGQSVSGDFVCLAPVAAQTFTVPTYVLMALPAGTGNTALQNTSSFSSFTASGLDRAITYGGVLQSINTTFN